MSAEAARQPAAGPIVDVRGVRKIYHRDAAEITVLDGINLKAVSYTHLTLPTIYSV